MKTDGSDRALVAPHGRQPFWSPDGETLAFTMGAEATAPEGGYENKGLYFYSIETRALSEAPRTDVAGLLAPGFTPDGEWVVASVINGMGFHHGIAAFTVSGKQIIPLAKAHWEHGRPCKNIYQCRPDVSPDGTRIAWGKDDIDNRLGGGRRSMYLEVAHIDLAAFVHISLIAARIDTICGKPLLGNICPVKQVYKTVAVKIARNTSQGGYLIVIQCVIVDTDIIEQAIEIIPVRCINSANRHIRAADSIDRPGGGAARRWRSRSRQAAARDSR